MAAKIAAADAPVWSESKLREIVQDTQRSAQSRSWALERLARVIGEEAAVPLAVELLADEEPHVASHALTMLEKAGRKECSEAVRAFSKRGDVPRWAQLFSSVLLASCGDEEAQGEAFSAEGAPAYFEMWAERDPQGFSQAAIDMWSEELAHDSDFLTACTLAATPELARPLLETLGELDQCNPVRDDLLMGLVARAGFGLPELGEDMPIEWHPRESSAFDSKVDEEVIGARFDELADLVADGDWEHVCSHCLETIGKLDAMGASEIGAPTLDWALALADVLDESPQLLDDPVLDGYECARLAFALQEAVLLVFDIEVTLEERGGLDDVLAVYGWSVGSERDRLEAVIRSRWDGSDEHQQVVTRWLDDIDDEFEWFDALEVAAGLAGYDISPCLFALVDEMEDDRAGYDVDWAAQTLIDVIERQPQVVTDDPDRFLLEDPLVSDCTLMAIARQPWRWVADIILERFDRLVDGEENEVLWETLAEVAAPESFEILLEQWQPNSHRLAHAIAFIADVCGRLDELPQDLQEELNELAMREKRYEKRLEAMINGDDGLDTAMPDGERIEFSLRCTGCEKVHLYQFDEVYLDRERGVGLKQPFDAVLLDRIVECDSCGAPDQFEPTERATHQLATMIAALIDAERWPEDARLQIWHPELWDGTTFRTPTEGIEHLQAQADAQPERPEPWRRLGHFCTRFHADEKAVEAYEHADELDGRGVPDPAELREWGIPTEPVGPDEAKTLLADKMHQHSPGPREASELHDHQLHECLVSAGWKDVENLASVFVSHELSEGEYAAAAFLVDLGSQGVREVIVATSIDAERYESLKERLEDIHGGLEPTAPELAARILDTAVRFSLALGFFPPDDYFTAREMLEGYDPEAADEDVPLGEQGLPLYVGDPDAFEPVVEQIYRRTGPDGFASI